MSKSINDWMREGEALYVKTLAEYQELDGQLRELEIRVTAKREELNQIAQVIGKPLENGRRVNGQQLVEETGPGSTPKSLTTIARALVGQNLNG